MLCVDKSLAGTAACSGCPQRESCVVEIPASEAALIVTINRLRIENTNLTTEVTKLRQRMNQVKSIYRQLQSVAILED